MQYFNTLVLFYKFSALKSNALPQINNGTTGLTRQVGIYWTKGFMALLPLLHLPTLTAPAAEPRGSQGTFPDTCSQAI